ncbi:MAG: UDP-N-acetylmuramoyl-tripeptide--D-alanyl-D-alanine ligase [bacterium]
MNIESIYQIFKKHSSVSTDTRKIQKGDIFVALKGRYVNGNELALEAIQKGASYALIDETPEVKHEQLILVDNVLETLQNLASYHRKELGINVIALTGSNGKTTTKELIHAVLRKKYICGATSGNFNNHIGVPLTLLSFNTDMEFGIVEMGANHQKEIAFLTNIAYPDYGLITNFGKAHLEGFGGIEGVIKGKSEMYDHLKSHHKTIFVNNDDPQQLKQIGNYTSIITFGQDDKSDTSIKFIDSDPFVKLKVHNTVIQSQLIGEYNYGNIAVAIAIGMHFEVPLNDIVDAIENYKPDNNRSEIKKVGSNKVILDAYNANPTSMLAALKNFKSLEEANKWLFLGDMFELGDDSEVEHQNIVNWIEENFEDNYYFIGEHFAKTKAKVGTQFNTFEKLQEFLKENEICNSTLLVKGSRGMALERMLPLLK